MVPEIKYLGVTSLQELVTLIKSDIAAKAEKMQFDTMPPASGYIGKIVQYTGPSNVSFARGHFYYSNGTVWTEQVITPESEAQIQLVTTLPDWSSADANIVYVLKNAANNTMSLYVKNTAAFNTWFTVESGGAFAIVAVLPDWATANPSTLYCIADGNNLTGYIKKQGTIGAWYKLGGGTDIVVDSVLSNSSTNPVQNKVIYAAIQDVLSQVASIYHYKGTCAVAELPLDPEVGDVWQLTDESQWGPIGVNVAWNGSAWDRLGGDVPDPVPTEGSTHSVQSGGVFDALALKESLSNKVTAIDGTATDDQYPSAKAVYDAIENFEPVPDGFIQNTDTSDQPVEGGKLMRIDKTTFDALPARDPDTFYYVPEEHDLIDAKPTCQDSAGVDVPGQKIVELTRAEYDALATKDPDTYYMVKESGDEASVNLNPRPDWSHAVAITGAQLVAGYTIPSDGMVVGWFRTSVASSTLIVMEVNGIIVARGYQYAGSPYEEWDGNVQCPVAAGDTVKIEGRPAAQLSLGIHFVPWKTQYN